MSEIKLILIDSQTILTGTTHGSTGDRCVAALSAEPETISELETALERFEKSRGTFSWLYKQSYVDPTPYDAGILVIDLAARIIVCDSTYSYASREGSVEYHDGTQCTDIPVHYRLPDDWLVVDSVEQYECIRDERRGLRAEPLHARAVLYGRPLLEFLARSVTESAQTYAQSPETSEENERQLIRDIHALWLMSPRDDLRGQSPRDVMLAKQQFIDYDMNSRETQWSLLREPPPCIPTDSFAYRYAGFGTHEWIIYYDLIRFLLSTALESQCSTLLLKHDLEAVKIMGKSELVSPNADGTWPKDLESQIAILEELKTDWLHHPWPEYDGIPAIYIDKERKRLPLGLSGREMIIDENCPTWRMMAEDMMANSEIGFEQLDASHMDEDFAFSTFLTRKEWETHRRELLEFEEQYRLEHSDTTDTASERDDPF